MEQAFRLTRRRTVHGKSEVKVSYGITSLRREQAGARLLLDLTRRHWGIENRLFHVRDVTFGEDGCRVRKGGAPIILAALRNMAIALLNRAGYPNKAAALRRHAAHPEEALAMIRAP